jgi:hypothetical protein
MKTALTQVASLKPIALFKKKIGTSPREAKEKKEDKMIWTKGNHP